jgi:hypothetical protein
MNLPPRTPTRARNGVIQLAENVFRFDRYFVVVLRDSVIQAISEKEDPDANNDEPYYQNSHESSHNINIAVNGFSASSSWARAIQISFFRCHRPHTCGQTTDIPTLIAL